MKYEEFKQEVMISLGGSLVDVELSEHDVYTCFKKAKRTFQQKAHDDYRCVYLPVTLQRGKSYYKMNEIVDAVLEKNKEMSDVHPYLTENTKIQFVSRGLPIYARGVDNYGKSGTWDQVLYNLYDINDSGGGFGGYMSDGLLMSVMRDTVNDSFDNRRNNELMCDYDPFKKLVHIVSNPSVNGIHLLECWVELEDEEYYDIDWIMRWTIAEAKQILGTAYKKFSSLPGPTGQTSLNGDSYISESKSEKEELLEEIQNYTDGYVDYGKISMF